MNGKVTIEIQKKLDIFQLPDGSAFEWMNQFFIVNKYDGTHAFSLDGKTVIRDSTYPADYYKDAKLVNLRVIVE